MKMVGIIMIVMIVENVHSSFDTPLNINSEIIILNDDTFKMKYARIVRN